MIEPGMTNFLIAVVTASASFIGLLFVAVSFVTNDDSETSHEFIDSRLLAESSYGALLNIFFIALVALIPGANVAYVVLAMAVLSLLGTLRLFRISERKHRTNITLLVSMFVYLAEATYATYVLMDAIYINNYLLMILTVFLFGVSVARAWELTGIRHHH